MALKRDRFCCQLRCDKCNASRVHVHVDTSQQTCLYGSHGPNGVCNRVSHGSDMRVAQMGPIRVSYKSPKENGNDINIFIKTYFLVYNARIASSVADTEGIHVV